jgi:hypothetical protein
MLGDTASLETSNASVPGDSVRSTACAAPGTPSTSMFGLSRTRAQVAGSEMGCLLLVLPVALCGLLADYIFTAMRTVRCSARRCC